MEFKTLEKTNSFLNSENLINILISNNIPVIPTDSIIFCDNEILGEGAFGKVYKGLYDKIPVAIKKLKFLDSINPQEIMQEIKAVCYISHPRIPRFHGIWKKNNYLNLIFDYISGMTLKTYYQNISYKEKLELSIQLVEIIDKMHDQNIIHRDLKLDNIMIMDGKVYVIDFGVSKIACHTITATDNQRGTVAYFSPENCNVNISNNEESLLKISTKFDIWSIACIISYIVSGISPWNSADKKEIQELVIISHLTKKKKFPIPETIPSSLRDILKLCFVHNPNNRISASELKKLLEEYVLSL